jgi:hypothetical protein
MKKLIAVAVISALPGIALADSVGGCGWGSKVFDGQSGVAPQVLAVTTNGTFGNQTFGITSGTSGCSQNGAVRSEWKTAMFIDGNKERLAREMSVGNGEALDSLAHLIGIRDEHRASFNRVAQKNFGRIFPTGDASTEQVVAGLKQVLAADGELAQYAASI